MVQDKRIFLKGRLWKAGTDSMVFGISKRDRETHGLEEGDVIQVEVLEVYKKDNTHMSEEKEQSKRQEKGAFNGTKGVKSTDDSPSEANAPAHNNKEGRKFNFT